MDDHSQIYYLYVTNHPGQLSFLPSAEWGLSTSQVVIVLFGW